MTTFFADIRIFPRNDEISPPVVLSVEVPAPDMPQALAILMAFKAGLSASPKFGHASEESLQSTKVRGRQYLTMREVANQLRDKVW